MSQKNFKYSRFYCLSFRFSGRQYQFIISSNLFFHFDRKMLIVFSPNFFLFSEKLLEKLLKSFSVFQTKHVIPSEIEIKIAPYCSILLFQKFLCFCWFKLFLFLRQVQSAKVSIYEIVEQKIIILKKINASL